MILICSELIQDGAEASIFHMHDVKLTNPRDGFSVHLKEIQHL